jgi:phosphoglycerate dehydrogenase-like enzyme
VEHPDTLAGECVDHLWRGTLGITHAAPITRTDLEGCHKLRLLVVTGPDPSCVDQTACAERGIEVAHLPVTGPAPDHAANLIALLEKSVAHQ